MTKTAVGLFKNPGEVGAIVRDLEFGGISRKGIRVLGEPRDMASNGVTSIPHTDFEVDVARELRAMGVVETDYEAYVEGMRRGGVMVFATGPGDKADAAVAIMNRHYGVEIEEISGSGPGIFRVQIGRLTRLRLTPALSVTG